MSNIELFSIISGSASIISLIVSIVAVKKVINLKKQINIDASTKKEQKVWFGIGNKQKMK